MANPTEGFSDDFFEQILAIPPAYASGAGAGASEPPAVLQLSSGEGSVHVPGGGGFPTPMFPLGLSLEPDVVSSAGKRFRNESEAKAAAGKLETPITRKGIKHNSIMELGSPRWKGGGQAISKSNPMSVIVSHLQEILLQSKAQAFVSGSDVFLEATANQRHLLACACFGVLEANAQQWLFQLDFEEAFYLFDEMNCISIAGEDGKLMGGGDIWEYMVSRKRMFPWHYQAYSHLRRNNWVVRSGSMYGVDFVVYRHHPALVHSEFAAIVIAQNNGENDARLRVWSDLEGMIRVCGSVAKTLLVIYVSNVKNETMFPSCVKNCTVNLHAISRWDPERCREDCSAKKQGSSKMRNESEVKE